MALVKSTRKAHGPTIYTLELTEAEAVDVYLALSHREDHPVYDGLQLVLPPGSIPTDFEDGVVDETDAEEDA